ncbi:hypothetical protein P3G55_21620 [Leptospira sp. 96542]|nr:hypothetical protein [Leptospira sp. 96542]
MMTGDPPPLEVRLPEALLVDFHWAADIPQGGQVRLRVPAEYSLLMESGPMASEVLAIQRLISLARVASIHTVWEISAWDSVSENPALYPLLSVLLALPRVKHSLEAMGSDTPLDISAARTSALNHRLAKSAAFASDIVLCIEGVGTSVSADLYNPSTLRLHPREYFESMAVDALTTNPPVGAAAQRVYEHASLLGTILSELIENSEMHGRLGADGRPILDAGVRGLLFRRVKLFLPSPKALKGLPKIQEVNCFEASIFDSGIGYFTSYTRDPLTPNTDLKFEWQVLHNCLERHYHPELLDSRPSHRGLGLYEVLRALQALKGRIEFRTGRLYAYRTFLDGELQAQMRPKAPFAHLAWPEPRLLDVDKKYLALPTEHEKLVGTSVRILVPLD